MDNDGFMESEFAAQFGFPAPGDELKREGWVEYPPGWSVDISGDETTG